MLRSGIGRNRHGDSDEWANVHILIRSFTDSVPIEMETRQPFEWVARWKAVRSNAISFALLVPVAAPAGTRQGDPKRGSLAIRAY
jgi:hypothetical protein